MEELLSAGHEVQWLVAPIDLFRAEVVRLMKRGAKVERLPEQRPGYLFWPRLRWKLREMAGANTLRKAVDRFRPDHIFVNQGATWCSLQREIWEVLEPRRGRYSLICHLGRPNGYPQGVDVEEGRRLMSGAKMVYFNSSWTKKTGEEQIGATIANSRFFQYPVRFAFERPLPWPKNPVPRIGMVNRIDIHHKGLDLAVEAVATLKSEGLRLELTIAGRGEDQGMLRELIKRHGVEAEVKVEPYTENLADFWKDKELFLLPSRFEGLAVAMVEAMGFGRPVLRTPYGGSEEWMEEGVNGWICPEATPEALTETLRRAVRQREKWQGMGQAAHAQVKRNLEPDPGRIFLKSLS